MSLLNTSHCSVRTLLYWETYERSEELTAVTSVLHKASASSLQALRSPWGKAAAAHMPEGPITELCCNKWHPAALWSW